MNHTVFGEQAKTSGTKQTTDLEWCFVFSSSIFRGQLNFELQLVNSKKTRGFICLVKEMPAKIPTKTSGVSLWAKVDLLSLLLKRQAESVSLGDADGDTALHHVAQATELEVCFFNELPSYAIWRDFWLAKLMPRFADIY